jgi:hypothetical protein
MTAASHFPLLASGGRFSAPFSLLLFFLSGNLRIARHSAQRENPFNPLLCKSIERARFGKG